MDKERRRKHRKFLKDRKRKYVRAQRISYRKQRRELRRIWFRRRLKILYYRLHSVMSVAGEVYPILSNLRYLFFNSLLYFLLAYWAVYLVGQFLTILVASHFGIPTVLYSYGTEWPLYKYSPVYSRLNLILVFGTGPFFSAVLATLLVLLVLRNPSFKRPHTGLLFWGYFHSVNCFAGAFITDVITRKGLLYVSTWMLGRPQPGWEELTGMLVAVGILYRSGCLIARYLFASSTLFGIRPATNRYYILAVLVLPLLIGNVCIALINFPAIMPEFLLLCLCSAVMIVPAFNPSKIHPVNRSPMDKKRRPPVFLWIPLLFLMAFSIFIRLVLFPGIKIF